MLLSLEFCDNGVIATVETPASEGTLASSNRLLFVSQEVFMEWMALQWKKEDGQ